MKTVEKDEVLFSEKYLQLLSKTYPDITSAIVEIVNLKAILNLPKGTEHFLTDIHGENEAFNHVMQNASGAIRRKINEELSSTLDIQSLEELKTLVYYPKEKLELIKKEKSGEILNNWYKLTIYRLIKLCRATASKYTRSKVRKALPKEFAYIMEELLQEDEHRPNKKEYYNEIINSVVEYGRADLFIVEISYVIKRFTIDHLHILGDIFDRGPGPDKVMETLMNHHSLDIQWGNHDILWMGAAAGSRACVCNVVRIALRYANNDVLENSYGINLLPLATFAERNYGDNLKAFIPKNYSNSKTIDADTKLIAKMHKAISIIQFKVEENIIKNNPKYKMEHRLILDSFDIDTNTVTAYGKKYTLNNTIWPTIRQDNPIKLTAEEEDLVDKLTNSFVSSEKLQKHIKFLFSKGSMYKTFNNNLLFHACLMMNEDGGFKDVEVDGVKYKGKALMDKYDQKAREAYFGGEKEETTPDFLWYLWCNPNSSLFGKDKMATFESYFIDDKDAHRETLSPYYRLMKEDDGTLAIKILKEFGLDEDGHIINGHTPVKTNKGETPLRAGGKQLVIDGGFSKAYQNTTGIAGYTLTYNSYGMTLISHDPFESVEAAVKQGFDIKSTKQVVEKTRERKLVKDTDNGKEIMKNIKDLEILIDAYRKGIIKQKL